jgi:type IV pilus assembly protein PilQ
MKTKFALFLILLAAPALKSLAQAVEPFPAAPEAATNAAPPAVAAPATNATTTTTTTTTPAPDAVVPTVSTMQEPTASSTTAAALAGTTGGDEVVASLLLDDLPLPNAVRQLATYAHLNIAFDPRLLNQVAPDGHPIPPPIVQETWKNVTALQALQFLLDLYGWQLEREPNNPIAKVVMKDPKALEPLVTKVVQLSYGEPREIMLEIKMALSPRSWITNDIRTHQLILITTEKELPDIVKLIAQLDTATRQVLIEAKIVETTKDLTSAKGINWTGTAQSQHVSFGNGLTSATTASGSTTAPGLTGTTTTSPSGRTLGNPISTVASNATSILTTVTGSTSSGGGFSANTASGISPTTAFLNADGVSAVMSFLNTDADTKSIALPRTVSLDGVSNRIAVIQNYPVFEQDQSAPLAGAAAGLQSAKPVYDLKVDNNFLSQVGIALSVIPRIAGPSNVIISVKPEISSVDANTASATINGQVSVAGIYDRSTIETRASVPSGYTLVLGGLDKDVMNKTYTKIPILGDLPGMGNIFGSNSKQHSRDTILIFITPTIIQDSDFQPTPSNFLNTKPDNIIDAPDSAWDSAVPYDWTKPRTDVHPNYQP